MCRKFFLLTSFVVVFVFASAFSTTVMASDIAFYVGQWNTDGWYDESQFQHVETIIAETGHMFQDIQQFDDTQFDEFGAWVDENTDDGEMDIIWLNGCTPSVLYPNPNEQPDGSRIEAWLDGGNMIINVGDWFAYCTYEGGPRGGEGRGGDNGGDGAANILDLSSGIIFGADGTQLTVTPTGKEYLPSLNDPAKTDRPVSLAAVEAPWEVAAIFASPGGTDDPAAEASADPVVIHNTETGGYVAFINQASGGPDGWIADRGLTTAEFIGNWVNSVIGLGVVERTLLFAEDFEGLELGPNVDEALAGDAVWTETAPEGWSIDESGIPGINLDATDGVTEWAGWAFTDKAWWTEAAEDQDRSLFELGSGIVAVADPDEWDDAERLPIPISADPYDTWLTTPEIKIASAEAGTLELKFDSSWRPEFDDNYHQTANITASFDGGDPVEVMLWESDEASPNYHPYATNETVIVKLDNPEGAKKVVLTFGLFDAGNDWWWAIDNIEVRGVVPYLGPVNPGTEGLAAYYPFENDVLDASGNGNDGTIVGDPVFVDGPAGYGMAMEFDGIDDYVDCGNAESLDITGDITVACWIKVAAFSKTWETILAKGDHAYRMSRGPGNGDSIHFGCNGPSGGNLNASTIVTTDTWRHVALVYDGTDKIIYIDGVEDARLASEGSIESHDEHNLFIGENSEAVNRFLTGLVDEVMIYNRALSEAEIRYLAGQRAIPIDPGSSGLLAWWPCDEGEGTVVSDVSSNGYDGVFVNGDPAWVEGIHGSAVELVGPTLIEAPPLNVELTEATMAGWILPYGPQPDWSSFIMQRDPGLATGFNILGYQLAYHWNDTSDSWSFRGGDMIAEDGWTFAAVTIEPDKATFYVNGEAGSVNEISHGPCLWNSNVYLGGDGTEGWVSRRMNGALDDVLIYDRALSTGEIRYLAGLRPMVDPGTDNLIAYYPLDIDTLDASGNGNDGTVNGDPTFVDGMVATAMEFDGDGDFLDCGNDPILALTDAVSISAWIKVAVQGADHKVGGNQDGANGGYKMSVYSDKIEFEIRTSGNSAVLNRSVAGGTVLEVDVWYHVVGVYSLADGYIRTYVNGELDRELETTEALGASPGSLMIGCEPFSTGQYNFNGIMDDVRVYNKALSEDEARYLANN